MQADAALGVNRQLPHIAGRDRGPPTLEQNERCILADAPARLMPLENQAVDVPFGPEQRLVQRDRLEKHKDFALAAAARSTYPGRPVRRPPAKPRDSPTTDRADGPRAIRPPARFSRRNRPGRNERSVRARQGRHAPRRTPGPESPGRRPGRRRWRPRGPRCRPASEEGRQNSPFRISLVGYFPIAGDRQGLTVLAGHGARMPAVAPRPSSLKLPGETRQLQSFPAWPSGLQDWAGSVSGAR